MKKCDVPFKNYIIALLISIITIILVLIISNYYKNRQEYENDVMSFLSEIKIEELDNFIIENHDVMVYLVNDSDTNFKYLQSQVKKIVTENDYTKDIVYLDLKNQRIQTAINKKYFDSSVEDIEMIPNTLLLIKEGKVVKILKIDDKNIKDLKNFINNNFYGA